MKIKIIDYGDYAEKYKSRIIFENNCYTMNKNDIFDFVKEAVQCEKSISVSFVSSEEENKDFIIRNIFKEIGIPSHVKGYEYLIQAIIIYSVKPGKIKSIYAETSKKFGAISTAVERSIRSAIENAWECGNPDILEKYFGYTINPSKGKATNTHFISVIAELMEYQLSKCV